VPSVSDGYLSVALRRGAAGRWQREWRADSTRYVAEAGQPLVYTDRAERQTQDWRDFPISGVSWHHVQQYLAWLQQRGIDGAALCTEEQWERAARGADERLYPHGNILSPTSANIDETYGRKPAAFGPDVVGSHEESISPFGVHDMAGNVWEMTRPNPSAAAGTTGSHTTDSPDEDVIPTRGGSFFHSSDNASAVNRWVAMSGQGAPFTGFRVCATAPVE
jgi:formylglycine-generating enzyme required for sulfatase activity